MKKITVSMAKKMTPAQMEQHMEKMEKSKKSGGKKC